MLTPAISPATTLLSLMDEVRVAANMFPPLVACLLFCFWPDTLFVRCVAQNAAEPGLPKRSHHYASVGFHAAGDSL
jgi:hypothetical protein